MARFVPILAIVCSLAAENCAQAQLTLLRSFSTELTIPRGPDGIAYHPGTDQLFAVDSSTGSLFKLTTDGQLIDSFVNEPDTVFYEGITTLPDGNLMVSDGGLGLLPMFTPDLSAVPLPLDINHVSSYPNGIVMVEESGSLFITDDIALQVFEIDLEGGLLGQLPTTDIEPSLLEPEGIAYEPASGHLLAVDDDQGILYEFTTDGRLVRDMDLAALTGFTDPEGLSYHAPTQTLYVAFDGDRQVVVFRFSPIADRFLRGDCNGDEAVNMTDAISTFESLFLGTFEITCTDACDSNDDGAVDIADGIATLGVLFLGNGIIPPPGMNQCGIDPTDDESGCSTPPKSCQ